MLDVVSHVVCAQHLMNQQQAADQLSDCAILRSIGDPRVVNSVRCQPEEVTILRNQDPTVTSSFLQVILV